MEIPQGYKWTELGVIPEEWEVYTIRDCINLLTDFDANGSFADVALNVNTYDGSGYAWYVRATDLERHFSLSSVKYVDQHSYQFLKKSSLYFLRTNKTLLGTDIPNFLSLVVSL